MLLDNLLRPSFFFQQQVAICLSFTINSSQQLPSKMLQVSCFRGSHVVGLGAANRNPKFGSVPFCQGLQLYGRCVHLRAQQLLVQAPPKVLVAARGLRLSVGTSGGIQWRYQAVTIQVGEHGGTSWWF